MKRIVSLILAAALCTAGCGGGGGKGGGPTEPSSLMQVAGTWQGFWETGNSDLPASMTLRQSGSAVSGQITFLATTFDIRGSVDASQRVTWSNVGTGCGRLSGDGQGSSLSPFRLEGSITLDTRGCSIPGLQTGTITWLKGGAKSVPSISRPGSPERLAEEIGAIKR